MFKRIIVSLALVLLPAIAHAQATTASKIDFDQQATTLAEANGFAYKYYPDGAATGIALTPVVCTGPASPFLCEAAFPAFTPGVQHNITITASNTAGESLKSTPFNFTFVVIPSAPTNLRIR